MEVVDYDEKYYQYIYDVLWLTGIEEKNMLISRVETKVLLCEDKPVGFFSGEKVGEHYNIYHFFIEPNKRGFEAIWKLVPYMIRHMKNLGCKYLLMHAKAGTDTDNFINSYFRKNNVEKIEFYKVEV